MIITDFSLINFVHRQYNKENPYCQLVLQAAMGSKILGKNGKTKFLD